MLDRTPHSIIQPFVERPLREDALAAYASAVVEAFAPMFGVGPGEKRETATELLIYFDGFCRAVDYVTDAPRTEIGALHHGALQFAKGVRVASESAVSSPTFFAHLERYLTEASRAEQALWAFRGAPRPYGAQSIEDLGHKNAVMKVAPAALALLSGKWSLLPVAEAALHDVAVATQLIDDILDWEGDLAAQIYTWPLALALERGDDAPSTVARVIFGGGVAVDVLNHVHHRLARAHHAFASAGALETAEIAADAIASVRSAQRYLNASPITLVERAAPELRSRLHPIICYSGP